MKTWRTWLATIALLLCCTTMNAHDFEVDGIYYNILSETDLTVEVTFKGDFYNSYSDDYTGEVVIPEKVTYNEKDYSVTEIGRDAFFDCSSLTNVSIPNSVTTIGRGAFYGCSGLTNITIPHSVKTIYGEAFYNCSNLTAVHITDLEAWCNINFYTKEHGTNPLNYAHHLYLNGEEVKDLVIPNSMTKVLQYTFSGSSYLTSITIPNSVTSIEEGAFEGCSSIKSINIPNSVTIIRKNAFKSCLSLTSINIPSSVTRIYNYAFENCSSLTSITVENENSIYDSREKCNAIIETATNSLILGCVNTIIPNSVTSIEDGAFIGYSNLTSINIPNSVTGIGERAFFGCTSLQDVTIPSSVISIGQLAFQNCPLPEENGIKYADTWAVYLTNQFQTSYTLRANTTGLQAALFKQCSELTSINIPNTVTSIGDYAFGYCSSLESINIPSSVRFIGEGAFMNCSNLTTDIIIPNNVTNIELRTFENCSSLTSINIPNSVTEIGSFAFYECSSLTSINIPNSVTNIGDYAFEDCSSLTDITIPNSVTSIGEAAFRNCSSLKDITIPNSVTSIGKYAFAGCTKLESVNIPNNLTIISYSVFDDCSSLTSINIPSSVTIIEGCAFRNCSSLTSINIPNSVTEIGGLAFKGCTKLESVNIPNSVIIIGDEAFRNCSSLTSISLSSYLRIVRPGAFRECSNLRTVTIEDIDFCKFQSYTFYDCTSLATIICKDPTPPTCEGYSHFYNVPTSCIIKVPAESVELYKKTSPWSNFNIQAITMNVYDFEVNGIYYNILSETDKTVEVTSRTNGYTGSVNIPQTVTYNENTYSVIRIGESAFKNCTELTNVTIPNSVTSIGESAFEGCSSLTDITIPNSVTSIGRYAFKGCPLLSVENNIQYADTWAVGITDNSQISYNLRPNTTGLADWLFEWCCNMTSINIPNSVLHIGHNMFEYCVNLVNVTIPNSVKNIGQCTFENCSNLQNVTISNSVTKITYSMFLGCSNLTNITIPNSVTSIGESAFSGCSSLTDITIPNSVTKIEGYAFSGCSGLTDITIPNSVTSIGWYAFSNCSSLTDITIPNSVTSIEEGTFGECSSLTNITIPNSVEEISYSAFEGCTSLASIICKNPTPPICNFAFGDFLPTSCIIKVPAESVELYKKTSPWSNYNIQAISTEVNLTDNEDYTNATDTERNTITYTRTLPNLLWNALYLPFEIPVSQLVNNYDVAYFNDVHSYDNDNDGDIDNMEMEVIKITSGTLKANYPYLIRAKSEAAKELSITVENATLHKAEQTTISCSSVFMRFDITGTYASMTADELDGSLVITTEGKWQQLNTTSSLKPYRLYLTLTTLDGSPIKVENAMSANGYTVSIRVKGEGATGIESEEINIESAETDAPIYNLMGQPVQHPVKGHIYIKGGRKVVY